MARLWCLLGLLAMPALALDPTRPPSWQAYSGAPSSTDALVLQQIIWRDHNPKVVINEQVLRLGDRVAGATLAYIGRTHVILQQAGQSQRLELLATTKMKVQ